jgi:hypothetical protein
MTETEKKFLDCGNALARALGHQPRCPKISPAIPCTCGEGLKQAQALSDWYHLMDEIEKS